ncbi:MAG: MBG domain-containing protein, partial [Fibrobacterota bacterium]
ADRVYSGVEHTPVPVIFFEGDTLEENVDFSLSHTDNLTVGTALVTVIGIGSFTGDTTLSFEIAPRELLVHPDTGQYKVYGNADPALTFSTSGSVGDETPAFNGSLQRRAGDTVGTYEILPGTLALVDSAGFSADNYTLRFTEEVLFRVTPKQITVRADSCSFVYGEAEPSLTWHLTPSLVSGDTLSGSLERAEGDSVGEYPILRGSLHADTNYTLIFEEDTCRILPRPLIISVRDTFKIEGEDDPVFATEYFGFAADDGSSAVAGLKVTREPGEDPGTYRITPEGAEAQNYIISYESAVLTIKKRNTPPVLHSVKTAATPVNTAFRVHGAYWNASDADGDALSAVVYAGEHYTAKTDELIPELDYAGVLKVRIAVTDGKDTSEAKVMILSVRTAESNRLPRISSVDTLRIAKNGMNHMDSAVHVIDPDGDRVFFLPEEGTGYSAEYSRIFPDKGRTGMFWIPFRMTDGIDTTAVATLAAVIYEKIADLDFGQVEETETEYTVRAAPIPAEPAQPITFQAQGAAPDSMVVRIFSTVGDRIHRGHAVRESRENEIVYVWQGVSSRSRQQGGLYAALVTLFRNGQIVAEKRIMIGIRRRP